MLWSHPQKSALPLVFAPPARDLLLRTAKLLNAMGLQEEQYYATNVLPRVSQPFKFHVQASQQIQLEPKDAMKARGLDSPDIGDCLAMSHSVKILTRRPAPKQVYSYPWLSDTARWMQ